MCIIDLLIDLIDQDRSFDSEQKVISRLFMKINVSKITGGLNLTTQGVKFRKNTIQNH